MKQLNRNDFYRSLLEIDRPMFAPGSSEEYKKKSIISLLLKLCEADNNTSDREMSYVSEVARFIGLPADQIVEIQKDKDNFELSPPSTEQERMTILYYLLFLSNVDRDINAEEVILIKKFGFLLGFRPDLTDDLLAVLRGYANQRIPPDAMVDVIRKYLN